MGSSRAPDMVVVTSAYGSEGDILPLLASRHARASASRGRMSPSLPYADVTTTMSGAREDAMGGAGGASECSR